MTSQDDKEDDEEFITGFDDDEEEEYDDEWSLGVIASLFSLFGVSMPKGEKWFY
jgi:hypothetical protein